MGYASYDIIELCKEWDKNFLELHSYDKIKQNIETAINLLRDNEEVLFAVFCNILRRGNNAELWNSVVMVTDSRLIYCGSSGAIIKSPTSGSIPVDKISSVSPHSGLLLASLTIECIGNDDLRLEQLSNVDSSGKRGNVNKIANGLQNAIDTAKANSNKSSTTIINQASAADELLKFKQLLDMGAITQYEFDVKKKQLLGL